MITTLFFAILGYTLLAIVSILDKSILSRSVKKSSVYTFYSTIFFFVAFLAIPWCVSIDSFGIFLSLISGLTYGFALWTLFESLKYGEASHVTPFVGAVVAVATYFLSYMFLGEVLGSGVKLGLIFLVGASLLLSVERSKKHTGFHKGFYWAFLSGVLFGVSHVFAKYIYSLYPFFTSIVWTKGSVGFVALFALCVPGVLSALLNKGKDKIKEGSGNVLVWDKALGIASVLLIQYAISIGSVTVVNGLAGIQYVLMFLFIYFLTKFSPATFAEKFSKKELIVESLALALIIIGLIFLQ